MQRYDARRTAAIVSEKSFDRFPHFSTHRAQSVDSAPLPSAPLQQFPLPQPPFPTTPPHAPICHFVTHTRACANFFPIFPCHILPYFATFCQSVELCSEKIWNFVHKALHLHPDSAAGSRLHTCQPILAPTESTDQRFLTTHTNNSQKSTLLPRSAFPRKGSTPRTRAPLRTRECEATSSLPTQAGTFAHVSPTLKTLPIHTVKAGPTPALTPRPAPQSHRLPRQCGQPPAPLN